MGTISDTNAAIEVAKEAIATLTDEIAELIASIKALDKMVAEATEQRKEENADLDKEMTEAETTEKDSQADYEALMKDSAEKRAQDSKTLSDKEGDKASTEGELETHKNTLKEASQDLGATLKYIHDLHMECDWLLKYFDVRKEMRASEQDALGKARAVLSGADYSLLQMA